MTVNVQVGILAFLLYIQIQIQIINLKKQAKIQMMDFLDKKVKKNKKKVGTPNKKIKLNEDNQSKSFDFQIPFKNLIFIKNISKTQNADMITSKKVQDQFKISEFETGSCYQPIPMDKQNNSYLMNQMLDEMDVQESGIPQKLSKKTNSMIKTMTNEYDHILTQLSLTKNNSTFPTVNFALEQNQQIGQNIFLNQLLTLRAKISLTDANNQNREILRQSRLEKSDQQLNRLQQDYEIKESLGKYQANKQNFICLSKLERIFYYVKKINLTQKNYSQNQFNLINFSESLRQSRKSSQYSTDLQLISQQVKLYNKDPNNHLTRFYQQWTQNNSVYMIYELGSYSLADKIESSKKLPESQVWSIIYDTGSSLKWIYQEGKMHMNLKPGNIINCRGKYKLADPFVNVQNLQTFLKSKQYKKQSFYFAPQVVQFRCYLEGIDFSKCQVYTLGMCILENITGMPIYMKSFDFSEIKAFFKKQMHGYSSYLKRLLLRMISKNYNKRPTLEELLCSNIQMETSKTNEKKNQLKLKRSHSI